VARFARNQAASQDRGGQAEKRTSFDLAHKLPLRRVPVAAMRHRFPVGSHVGGRRCMRRMTRCGWPMVLAIFRECQRAAGWKTEVRKLTTFDKKSDLRNYDRRFGSRRG
jgi:hypothetical protein